MNVAHPKTNIRRTFAKLCFDFMADSVAIEPGFCQQVVAEAVKNISKRAKGSFRIHPSRLTAILIGRKGRKKRYMKCEAIDARTLVRT
jgi:hypothetical protein